MRIISGKFGGRRINPPANMPHTRPTTDSAKEGLFNILQNNLDFNELKTLDLFGGTGSISYELASRGVGELTVIERDPHMHKFIKQTAADLKIQNFKVVKSDVVQYIKHYSEKFDFIFAGPPYAFKAIDELPKLIFEKELLSVGGWFVLEHTQKSNFENFNFFKTSRNYGTTVFSIFVNSFSTTE